MNEDPRLFPANDNFPLDDPFAEVVDDDTPASPYVATTAQQRAAVRARVSASRAAEKARMAPILAKLRKRQAIGSDWDGAANDNEDFPLLAYLRREGAGNYARLIVRYRALVALCAVQPLQGQEVRLADGLSADRFTAPMAGAASVDDAAAKGFPNDQIPGGEIRYRSARQSKGGTFSLPPRKAISATEDSTHRTASLAMKFTPDVLHWAIDAKPILQELRSAIGPLLDPFEDACLGGKTFSDIGRAEGFNTKPEGPGKALVMRAIIALDDAWHDVAVRERALKIAAERNVERKRVRIAERKRLASGRVA